MKVYFFFIKKIIYVWRTESFFLSITYKLLIVSGYVLIKLYKYAFLQ